MENFYGVTYCINSSVLKTRLLYVNFLLSDPYCILKTGLIIHWT